MLLLVIIHLTAVKRAPVVERNLEIQLQKEPRDILIIAGVIEGRKDFYFAFL